MAHELDLTTGRAAMAYTGDTPWHGLGQALKPGASLQEWRQAAGLNWECRRDAVLFARNNDPSNTDGELGHASGQHVLWRSDTGAPLAVVSKDYQVVQPADAMEFFRRAGEANDFHMETAGALFGGRRIWALACAGEDAAILDDIVRPYLLLATSYDGSMATVAQFTSVRVVCNNTLTASLANNRGQNRVRVPHSTVFCPDKTLATLGLRIDGESWQAFTARATRLARRRITDPEMDAYLQLVLGGTDEVPTDEAQADKVRASKGYRRIMALFQGEQLGGQQDATRGTAWGALHALTQYVDWEVGRLQSNRLDSAWFGQGASLKNRAAGVIQAIASA